jgi:outer membrane protein assembly factor BamB
VDAAPGYPVEFSPTKNVVWKVAVPHGQSSPVIVGTRLYLTASEGDRLITISLDARNGTELWRREVTKDRPSGAFKANDPASPTPAADENGVVAFFPDFGVVAYGTDGQTRWTMHLGPFRNFYGMAGSPIIADGSVVLVCDQQAGAFVIAIDRTTGRQRWRVERPGVRIGGQHRSCFVRPRAAPTSSCWVGRGWTPTTWPPVRNSGGSRSDPAMRSARRWSWVTPC